MKKRNTCLLLAFNALVLLLTYLVHRVYWDSSAAYLWEAVFFLFVLNLMIFLTPLGRFLAQLPRLHVFALLVLFFPLCLGQFVNKSKALYPFVTWRMFAYPEPEDSVTFFEIVGEYEDGRRTIINPAFLYPTLAHGRLTLGIDLLMQEIEWAEKNGVSDRESIRGSRSLVKRNISHGLKTIFSKPRIKSTEEKRELVSELMHLIGNKYNKLNKDKTIRAVYLIRGQASTKKAPIKMQIARVELKEKP